MRVAMRKSVRAPVAHSIGRRMGARARSAVRAAGTLARCYPTAQDASRAPVSQDTDRASPQDSANLQKAPRVDVGVTDKEKDHRKDRQEMTSTL